MARPIVDMEPAAALAGMVAALAEAGRYAGHGMRTTGKRVGRRAYVVGTEAADRAALAARVLGGRPLPEARRASTGLVAIAAAAAAAGAVAAVAVRRSVIGLRARATGNGAPISGPAAAGAQAGDTAAGDGSGSEEPGPGTGHLLAQAGGAAG